MTRTALNGRGELVPASGVEVLLNRGRPTVTWNPVSSKTSRTTAASRDSSNSTPPPGSVHSGVEPLNQVSRMCPCPSVITA